MSFQKNAQSLKSKLHLSEVNQPLLVGIIAVVLAVFVLTSFALIRFFTTDSLVFSLNEDADVESSMIEKDEGDVVDGEAVSESGVASVDFIYIHVSGEVLSPGVVEIPKGSRAFDAIEAAGGFTDAASPESLNLAREVQDGEQLYVLSSDEVLSNSENEKGDGISAGESASVMPNGLININNADQSALESLPGIGSVTAQKIIQEREANGPFSSVEDLKRVSGIGDKKFDSLVAYICVQ